MILFFTYAKHVAHFFFQASNQFKWQFQLSLNLSCDFMLSRTYQNTVATSLDKILVLITEIRIVLVVQPGYYL